MAIELELDQPPPATSDERERLNRTRTWLNCFCVDGSHAIQFGKLPMLRLPVDDYLARHSRDWYKSSALNISLDIHLCGYVEIITLMAEFRRVVPQTYSQATLPEVRVCPFFLRGRVFDYVYRIPTSWMSASNLTRNWRI